MVNIENYHLKSHSFYEALDETELKDLESNSKVLCYAKGEELFKEGSLPKGIYILQRGTVKVYRNTVRGSESLIYIYSEGDYFGHRPLIAQQLQPVSATAMSDVEIRYIPRDYFLELYRSSERFARQLLENLTKEFSVWVNKMSVFTEYSVRERVALSLLILEKVYSRAGALQTKIKISRKDFAGFVGTAKESLVRTLRLFKDEKLIESDREAIVIVDAEALRALLC